MSAKKRRALETATWQQHDVEANQATVVSSADGTKILKNLDTLADQLDKNESNRSKTFMGNVAKAIGASEKGSSSQYATFETKNGIIVTIRLANHNASTIRFDNAGRDNAISIVITNKNNTGIERGGNAHIVEFYYNKGKLINADGKPLAEIVRSIKQALYSGEFEDTTGLAERQEVNAEDVIRYNKVYHGSGADFDRFDHVIFDEKDAKITDHVRFFRTADGVAYGYTIGGKIYIDPRIANAETPVHEYAHLWATALRKGNAEEWKNVVGLMKDTKVWDEVRKRYPELKDDNDIADEVLATYSGRRGAERLRKEMDNAGGEAKGALARVKQTIGKFWKNVADMLHIHYTSAEEVADRVMKDLLDGVDPRKLSDDSGSRETSGSRNSADPMKGMEKAAEAYREEQRLKLQKKDSEEDEMLVSLQNKKGKEYYDTVTELARRIATNETQSRRGALELSEQPRIRGERSGRDAEDGHESVSLLRGAIHIIAQERRRALGENGERNWRNPRNKQGDENLITRKNLNITSADTKLRKEIERRVYEWAQANDMLFSEDEVRENSYGGKLLGKGSEAHAYLTKDRSKVIKFVKPDFFTIRKDLGGYAEYIDDFNNVFPDTAYKIIGMSKDGRGKILVVTEQPFVDGKQLSLNGWEKNNCNDKVRKYFADKGFEDLYGDAIYFGNNDYYVSDIGYGNVVFKNGEPVVIDANVLPMSVIREQQREKEQQYVKKAGIEISHLEAEIQNERNVIEYFKKARNDENKDSIDGFIARHEQKIKDFQKKIADKKAELGGGVHYRVEEEPLPTVWLPKDDDAILGQVYGTAD